LAKVKKVEEMVRNGGQIQCKMVDETVGKKEESAHVGISLCYLDPFRKERIQQIEILEDTESMRTARTHESSTMLFQWIASADAVLTKRKSTKLVQNK